jgi:hypothetical protein
MFFVVGGNDGFLMKLDGPTSEILACDGSLSLLRLFERLG